METQVKQKWFFPIQEEIRKAMAARHMEPVGYCVRQEVGKDFYMEIWNCKDKVGGDVNSYVFFYNKSNPQPHLFIYMYLSNYRIETPVSR